MHKFVFLIIISALTEGLSASKDPLDSVTNKFKSIFGNPIGTELLNVGLRQFKKMTDFFSFMPPIEPRAKIDNPDEKLSAPAMIARNGYPCETHIVISQGYVMHIHRIPNSKFRTPSSKTVLLHHGIFGSSDDWLLNGKQSLGYVLADAGYDVWMANARGNRYSGEHASLKQDSKTYWNFSWHDIALYDVPAIIDFIMKLKGHRTKISFIGHSMGNTILFAMLSLRPKYNKILNTGIALAPIAFVSNVAHHLKKIAPMAENVAKIEMSYGSYEVQLKKLVDLGNISYLCKGNDNFKICKEVLYYFCGEDESQLDESRLQLYLGHIGVGTSWKTVVHYAQEVIAKRFQQFDYGSSENMRIYGKETPPKYDLSKVTLPLLLIWAKNDPLSNKKDVMKLYNMLYRTTDKYLVPYSKFNHLDYLLGRNVSKLVNDKVLEYLGQVHDGRGVGKALKTRLKVLTGSPHSRDQSERGVNERMDIFLT